MSGHPADKAGTSSGLTHQSQHGYAWTLFAPGVSTIVGMGVAGDQDGFGRQVGALLSTCPAPIPGASPNDHFTLRVEPIYGPSHPHG